MTFTGSVDQLASAMESHGCNGPLFATDGGSFVPFFPTTRVAAVNLRFRALFPGGTLSRAPLLAQDCGSDS